MNSDALRRFRQRLRDNQPVYGLWVTLESPSITEMAVALDLDWVVVDAEHGHLDWKEVVDHLRAGVRSQTVLLVRVAELNQALIKRALDIGADGIVIPFIETAEQLASAISFAKYPPEGRRGIGAERATAWGQAMAAHAGAANDEVLIVPIIETVRAAENAAQLVDVPGSEMFFFGPADFSASAGFRGQWEGPGVHEQILKVKDLLRSRGKHCGLMTTSTDDLQDRQANGFQMLGLGADAGLLIRALRSSLASVGRDRAMNADLSTPATPGSAAKQSQLTPPAARSAGSFRVGITADFNDATGKPRYQDIGLSILASEPAITSRPFAQHQPEIDPQQLVGSHAVLVLTPKVTRRSLEAADDLLTIARFGVGYDTVDVAACTERDVLLTITVGAVDRPVAEATVGWMLALNHHVRTKDRLVREARWDDRSGYMGTELRERQVGIIGFGGIGREVVRLLAGFGMRPPLVFDPYADPAQVTARGCRAVSLDELLRDADFVSLHCPLNDATRGLIGARELALMKPTAYFVNTARGGIVEEGPLYEALKSKRIAGAALDCFIGEPLTAAPPFAELDNVLLAPHSIAWTEELFRDIGRTACQGIVDLAQGRSPYGVVNPQVLSSPGFLAKWRRAIGA